MSSRIQTQLSVGLVLVISLICSGCASYAGADKPSRERLEKTATEVNKLAPVEWLGDASSSLPSTDWVNDFNSEQLSTIVATALLENTDVRIAQARWRAATASAVSGKAGLLPDISATARASRTEFENNELLDSSNYTLVPAISWEADVWGRVRNIAAASERDREASRADFAGVRLSIAATVAQSWFDLIETHLQLELSKKEVRTQSRALALTQRRFYGGVSGSSDVRLAKSSLANAEATLASREQAKAATARRLEILLRKYPANALSIPADLPELPALDAAGQPIDIFSKRPDLLASEQRMQAAGIRVNIARKNLLPRLTLTGSGNLGGDNADDLFDVDTLFSNIAAGLAAPIFNAGSLRAEVRRNEAVLQQQLESYVGVALNAYLEVENALDAEQRLLQREQALRTSLTEAERAEERLELRYSEGLASILQLLDAQSRAIAAEGQLINARKERLNNRIRLHLALGGGDLGQLPEQEEE